MTHHACSNGPNKDERAPRARSFVSKSDKIKE